MAALIKMSDARRIMDLNFKAGLPLMFEGASGIGKTDLAEQYADDQNKVAEKVGRASCRERVSECV